MIYNKEKSLTPEDVADILNIAKTTVYEMVKRGDLRSYRIGRKLRFDIDDVEVYRKSRKGCICDRPTIEIEGISLPEYMRNSYRDRQLIIAGQGMVLDVLVSQLEPIKPGIMILRSFGGSYKGLVSLYNRDVDVAGVRCFGRTNDYGYVKNFMPGIACSVIHLVRFRVGFYVKKNNPRGINGWSSLENGSITLVNRESGSDERMLLDSKLLELNIAPDRIAGYSNEVRHDFSAAAAVIKGSADVAVGSEFAAMQIPDIDFIPLNWCGCDLAFRTDESEKTNIKSMVDIIRSEKFFAELNSLDIYDLRDIGRIVFIR